MLLFMRPENTIVRIATLNESSWHQNAMVWTNTSKQQLDLPSLAPMAGEKVFLFGSFTEEETKSMHSSTTALGDEGSKLLQGQLSSKAPEEKIDFQFGSVDFSLLSMPKALVPKAEGTVSPPKAKTTVSPLDKRNNHHRNVKKGDRFINSRKEETSSSLMHKGVQSNGCSRDHVSTVNGTIEKRDIGAYNGSGQTQKEVFSDELSTLKMQCDSNCSKQNMHVHIRPSVLGQMRISNEKISPGTNIVPHGLINTGNKCFLNATLQALLSCLPFVQLLQDLRSQDIPKVGFPTLSAFVGFITQFDTCDNPNKNYIDSGILVSEKALDPFMFDNVLRNFSPDIAGRSLMRQEDAQEFLNFVMDRMHEELLKLNGNSDSEGSSSILSSTDEDGWETVGPKNKSAKTTTQSFSPSELSAIFGGQLHNLVKASGNKASATIEPFLLLHLDILQESVRTIEDALHLYSSAEELEDYKISSGKAGIVSARKFVKIHKLPKILILHLKRFKFGMRGSSKLNKHIFFPLELSLSRDLFVSPPTEGRKFELVATITHHGNEPSRGHYTADARYSGQWLRYNDSYVSVVSPDTVQQDAAYILFYQQV